MRRRSLELSRFLLLVAVVLPFAACRDIVYRDRPLFDEPVAAAGGFVGYSNVERQMTVCGQCHISTQRRWEETAHAGAWQTIDTIAGAPALCRACHTTNERGNVATGTAGYLAHPDTRYHDVQCEACHGPGLEHVRSPERDNWPLAPMAVGASLTTGCGECHSGAHHPFVEQWAASRHANIRAGTPTTNVSCQALVRDEIDGLIAAILAMEAEVPPGEFNAGDLRYSTAEGARFNRRLAEFRGSEVHNPALTKALLRASIRQLQQDYGVAPPPGTLSAEPGLN
jgi:hypothetical protein